MTLAPANLVPRTQAFIFVRQAARPRLHEHKLDGELKKTRITPVVLFSILQVNNLYRFSQASTRFLRYFRDKAIQVVLIDTFAQKIFLMLPLSNF